MSIIETLSRNADHIISFGTAGGILFAVAFWVYRKGWRPARRAIREHFAKVDALVMSVRPNGGSSLYDRVDAIDRRTSASEVRSRLLLQNLAIIEWQSNAQGHCVFINAAACRLLDRSESDFIGRNWVNVVYPADRQRVVQEWDTAVHELRTFELRYRWLHNDGSAITIQVTANPLIDSRGNVVGWIAVGVSIPPHLAPQDQQDNATL